MVKLLVRYRAWLLVGVAIVMVIAVRVRLREMPLERDEGEYAYAGQLILHGVPPYKDAYNMKLPGTYAAYALIMAVFGQSPAGIHLGVMLVNAASIILVFLLGRKLLDDVAGATAAICYALLSSSQSVLGLMGHATHFVVLPALAGLLLLLKAVENTKTQSLATDDTDSTDSRKKGSASVALLLAGVLFGIAFLMKQHGLFFGLCGLAYLAWVPIGDWLAQEKRPGRPRPPFEVGPLIQSVALFAGGLAVPYLLTCLVLWWAGVFPQFWFWTVSYASKYASIVSAEEGQSMFRLMTDVVIGSNIALWLLPLAGALMMWWEPRLEERLKAKGQRLKWRSENENVGERLKAKGQGLKAETEAQYEEGTKAETEGQGVPEGRFFLAALLVCSVASVAVGFYFRPHYFITLLPVMSLLSGVAVSRSVALLKEDRSIELFLAVPVLGLFALGSLAAVIGNGTCWFGMTPERVVRATYSSTLFSEAKKAADLITAGVEKTTKDTKRETKVAVIGSEPEIYFYTGLRSATGYIYTYPLMENQPFALKMQEEMIAEIERARPEYLVYVQDDYSWLRREDSNTRIFDWWQDYWGKHMDVIGTLKIEQGTGEEDALRKEEPSEKPAEEKYLLVLRRRN